MGTLLFIIGILIGIGGIGILIGIGGIGAKFAGFAAVALGFIFTLATMFTIVDARSVGVQTSMGKYTDTVGPGLHLTAPWSSVEDWTTRNQTIRFAGDGGGEERANYFTESRIKVKLGTQAEAYVDVNITWKITEKSVGELWKQHKTFEDARRDFVTPAAMGAVNAAFDGYDPFKQIGPAAGDVAATMPVADDKADGYIPLSVWSKRVTEALRPMYAARNVELVSVQVTYFDYDPKTKDKLSALSGERQNTNIAAQKVETAKKEAEASAIRAQKSGTGCEALVRDLAAQDKLKDLPAGVQICSGSAGGGGVIVNGAR